MSKIKISMVLTLCLFSVNLSANELKEEKAELSRVVVSASGFESDADTNLRNVLIISGAELQNKGYTSVEQALQRVAGISFVDFGLGKNIDLRGQGDKSNIAVKVMIDGKAINVLDNSHGVTPLNSINFDNIERIEIIPGGGSVLYGNGTRGGVVNIITKKKKQDSFAISLKGSSFDKKQNGGNLGLSGAKKINDKLAFSFDINGFNEDGYQKGYNQKGYYINSKAYIDLNDESELKFAYNYFKSTNTGSGYLTKAQIEANPTKRGNSENITSINRPELSLDYNYYLNEAWEFSLSTFWQNQKINYIKDITSMTSRGMSVPVYQNGSGFEDTLLGISLKSKYNYKENSYLVLGYEFENHDAKRTSIVHYDVNYSSFTMSHTMTTLMDMNKQSNSFFVLDSHAFNENFSLSGGVRYERSTYETDRNYTSKMVMMGNPTPSTPELFDTDDSTDNFAFELTPNFKYSDTGSVYLKYERGFVSPSPSQFVNKDQATKKYYAADLDPEIFNTFELGLNDFWWDFYSLNFNIFYTLSKDEISYLGNPHSTSGAFWKYYNIDETTRYGAELNLEQSFLNDDLLFKQSLTYLNAKISKGVNDGKLIPYVSKIKATFGAQYAINSKLNTFLDLTYYSRAKDGGSVDENTGKMTRNSWMKDYFITDIGTSYKYKNLQIIASIQNLFDKQYFVYQDSINDQYLPGNGRSYHLEFKYAF